MPTLFISQVIRQATGRAGKRAMLAALLVMLLLEGCTSTSPGTRKPVIKPGRPLATGAPTAYVPAPARALFARARSAMHDQDWAKAARLLTKFTRAWPDYSSPFTDLGMADVKLGKDNAALQAFGQAIHLQPADCRPRVETGILLRHRHEFHAAEQAYVACLARHPDNEAALLNLGILYEIYMGRLPQALASYRHYQSLQKTPDKRVAGWIAALSRHIAHTNAIAAGDSDK